MKTEKPKKLIRWYILGAVGRSFMAAGDWLLGCIPLQETDTGLFNRAYYLSGSYGLWKPVLTVGLGAVGGFLYYFVVKACTQWGVHAYRSFSYDGERKLSKQIIEGTAHYVTLPEGGIGLDVGCGSGALTHCLRKAQSPGKVEIM